MTNRFYDFIDDLTKKKDQEALTELYREANDEIDKLYLVASIAEVLNKTEDEVLEILEKVD